jgi:hypothetical protein
MAEIKNPSGFLQEDNGNNSSMRLMSFLALTAAAGFGYLAILKPDNQNAIYVFFGFLIAAFAPKAIQKFAEQAKVTK